MGERARIRARLLHCVRQLAQMNALARRVLPHADHRNCNQCAASRNHHVKRSRTCRSVSLIRGLIEQARPRSKQRRYPPQVYIVAGLNSAWRQTGLAGNLRVAIVQWREDALEKNHRSFSVDFHARVIEIVSAFYRRRRPAAITKSIRVPCPKG